VREIKIKTLNQGLFSVLVDSDKGLFNENDTIHTGFLIGLNPEKKAHRIPKIIIQFSQVGKRS
jgi:hypothetical protein